MHSSTARKVIGVLNVTEGQLQNSLARAIAWALPIPDSADKALGFYAEHNLGYVRDCAADLNEIHVIDVPKLITDVRELYDARLCNAFDVAGCVTHPIAPVTKEHVHVLTEAVKLICDDYCHKGYTE